MRRLSRESRADLLRRSGRGGAPFLAPIHPMSWRSCCVACFGLCLVVGCGDSKSYELAPVSGFVTLDGEPLAGAIVNFQPIAGESDSVGPGSTARCNDEGRFALKTIEGAKGAVVGEHRIRIYSYNAETDSSSDEDTVPVVERVPEEYNYKSQVRFTVPPAGSDAADFAITTK